MRRGCCNVHGLSSIWPTTTATPFVAEKLTVVSGTNQKERIDD